MGVDHFYPEQPLHIWASMDGIGWGYDASSMCSHRPSENVIRAGPSQGSIVQLAHLKQHL